MTWLETDKILQKMYYAVDRGFGSAREIYQNKTKI